MINSDSCSKSSPTQSFRQNEEVKDGQSSPSECEAFENFASFLRKQTVLSKGELKNDSSNFCLARQVQKYNLEKIAQPICEVVFSMMRQEPSLV
jgi:hypothetical protein